MSLAASLGLPKLGTSQDRSKLESKKLQGGFIHSVLGFTRLEIPTLEVFETAVMFDPATDPVTAHDALAEVFGQKAGQGKFVFRLDSSVPGRYWLRSTEPWTRWPTGAVNALDPKREVIQLAEGLMYRFTLPVCAGQEQIVGGEKRVVPFESVAMINQWLKANVEYFGFKPVLANIALATLRFTHRGAHYKLPHAVIEGALEVTNATHLRRRLIKGFGSHRKAGLGMLQIGA